jgi:predicted PurR-regulated permease PerM
MVYDQFRVFISKFPVYITNLTDIVNNWIEKSPLITNLEGILGKEILPLDSNAINQYMGSLFSGDNLNFLQGLTSFTKSFLNLILAFVLGPILSIYILKDAGKFKMLLIKISPAKYKYQLNIVLDRLEKVGGRYLRGQIFVSIIVGFLCGLVLFLLKVDFPVLLGFIAGITNLIPFIGPFIGAVPAALAALFISPLKALLVILLFIAIQQLDSYVISPNVMKHQVGVHPAVVILVLIAAGAVFGPIGLLIAVPITAMIQSVLKYYLIERRHSKSR